jgi:nitrate/nitrite-specific signal transduction histidine kinase
MNNENYTTHIKKLEKQQKQALSDLLELAKERKANDLAPWNNPAKVQKIIEAADKKYAEDKQPDLARLLAKIGAQYSGLLQLYGQQADELAEQNKVSESITGHIKLMTCIEMLYLAYADTMKYLIELVEADPSKSSELEKLYDAMKQDVESFIVILESTYQQHKVLYDILYAWHP